VSQRVDFSGNASIYDRRHGTVLALDAAYELARRAALRPGCRVLDVAAGTGRVTIAFASIGCATVALDSAASMLNQLRQKAPGSAQAAGGANQERNSEDPAAASESVVRDFLQSHIRIVVGEGARLPFGGGHFDAVILARVLYLMADWQMVLRQSYDVLKPGGRLLHEWGNGQTDEPWVQIREKARTLFQDAGIGDPFHPGAQSEAEVGAVLAELGFDSSDELHLGPGPGMTLRDFVGRIVSGEMSYIWNVPKYARESCLPRLTKWCQDTFDMERPVPIPREIRWAIYRKR
jgi:ubiquinone/menaquinone biosynthesis C-methylase UbiE